MLVMHKRSCSWLLLVAVGSVVVLICLAQFSLSPWGSTRNYFSVKQAQTTCIPHNIQASQSGLSLSCRFPADLHKAVVYHGAPWKAEIGQWLLGCDSVVNEISITEKISGKVCKNFCSGRGVCNHELGQCRCFHGYSGEQCSEILYLACNYPVTPDLPYGRFVVSICPGQCDTTRAMCFCGEGTKYPYRPVAEHCGFKKNASSILQLTDWGKPDTDVFTTNRSVPGWCNVDPGEAYAGKAKFKEECHCKYDGRIGQFCEVPVMSACINQCSGHGFCRGGFCQCHGGWYGADCSIPSVSASISDWPQWLRPAHIDLPGPGHEHAAETIDELGALVTKKRPLIYVYDLPPEFNSLLLEGRHFKFQCVNRLYDHRNATVWTEQLYGAQMAFYESILASPYRTLNGDEADFFFVPILDSCLITRGDDAPHLNMQEHRGVRSSFTLEFYKKAYDHIVKHYPYWKRSSGKDHIWFFSWDEGACYAPKEIWNSVMLVHWGNTNTKHKHSTTAYWADNWDGISPDRRGNHPCFDPSKDLVLPAWKRPDGESFKAKLWARPHEQRRTLFYFNGNLGPSYELGRPQATYSMGIRQKLAEEFGSSPNKDGKLGRQHQEDVIVTPLRSDKYKEELASSVFCGVFPGDGWSGRMEDSILHGCIPVIIQDGIFLPYENVLNYESFAVRISEDEIPNLIKVLRAFNKTEIEFKLANIQRIWQRFLYHDSVLREAERQKSVFGHVDDWAAEILKLTEDDAFATLIQVLHYKLHNDPWRKQAPYLRRASGLPQECLAKG
ncbi:uncharacterized protein LOC130813737 isoform X1 [Amaranthus tricolor]|uniref:uncharacterized protein LOC130813737 isoform X1 n=1 Tax=Amaranthus tricolor TaxID=29722 RepID=UPI00258A93A6|nr:uncharacterized protein LOC130813737 isoform X1 [Amaranthus tricolor]XP_057535589.1 uncharacterized protein LOC130813737 isoform X1 [Amaranthus tricolor]